MIPVPSSSLRVKKWVFPTLSLFCQFFVNFVNLCQLCKFLSTLSFFVNFHGWPHLARARQAGARSWQWPHLGLASEVIKISKKGQEEVGQKNDQVRTKLEGADRSPVEVDEPGCVPVENALLELSAVGKLVFVQNFWIVAMKTSSVDENAQQYSILGSPPYIMSSFSYR